MVRQCSNHMRNTALPVRKLNKNKELVTNGGRVLNIISKEQTLKKAKAEAYKLIKNIKCSNLFYRKDIGD